MKGRFAAFFALLAASVLALRRNDRGAPRTAEGRAAAHAPSAVAYAGRLIGATSFTIATVTFSGASAEGAQANPVSAEPSRRVTWAAVPRRPDGICRVPRGRRPGSAAHGVLPRWTESSHSSARVDSSVTFLTTLKAPPTAACSGTASSPASSRW